MEARVGGPGTTEELRERVERAFSARGIDLSHEQTERLAELLDASQSFSPTRPLRTTLAVMRWMGTWARDVIRSAHEASARRNQ